MKLHNIDTKYVLVALFMALGSCVEPFVAETLTFENVLVIDARITDELKQHEVILRRTYPFENSDFEVESNATIQIRDDSGATYNFQETKAGNYQSTSAFAARPDMSYTLSVTTAEGRSYISETVMTPERIAITELKAEIGFDDEDNEGLSVQIKNESANAEPKYFRYEYEETYKIVAPFYNPFEFDVIDSLFFQEEDNDPLDISIKPRVDASQFCYASAKSLDLILRDSEQNVGNAAGKFEIRFLENNDFKIAHRYSILIKQYNLSADSYSYYSTLRDFTSDESVFTDIQPGLLEGNIKAQDPEETVLGYFEIAAITNERLFFDYVDFYPDRQLPPYIINCELTTAPQLIAFVPHVGPGFVVDESDVVSPLLDGIQAGLIAYHEVNEDYEPPMGDGLVEGLGPFFVKATGCIDCREFGSNVKPDFWID